MALDNNKGTRKPHAKQKEFEEQKKALEDRIVNDKDMASKIYQHAMESEGRKAEEQNQSRAQRPHTETRTGAQGEAERQRPQANREARTDRAQTMRRTEGSDSGSARRAGAEGGAGRGADETRRQARPVQRVNLSEAEQAQSGRMDARRSVRQMNNAADSDEELRSKRQAQESSKKKRRRNILIFCIVEFFTLIVIFGIGMVIRYANMTQQIEVDKKQLDNTNLEISKKQAMEGSWTVALFGVDTRDGSLGKGANADVQIIANVDRASGDVKLVSVYRDTYLNVSKGNTYAKINQAYAMGGPEQAIQALNKNLDLNITDYVTFNWKAVIDVIDLLGGIEDVDIESQTMLNHVNAYIHQSCLDLNISAKNPAAMYVKGTGVQHLSGIQALAYVRIRKFDTDFKRTERQRIVIEKCLEKAKQADLATLLKIIDTVMPQIAFNVDTSDIIQMAKGVSHYNIVGAEGFPNSLDTQMMGKRGDCVIPITLASNVTKLHEFLYNDTSYDPSDAVKRYSNKIADDSGKYKSGYSDTTASETKAKKTTTAADEENESTTSKKNISETTRVDRDGYIIVGMDEKGKYIYETDSDGSLVKAKETSKSSETASDEGSAAKRTTESTKEGETETSTKTKESTASEKETTKHNTATTVNPNAETTRGSEEPVVPNGNSSGPSATVAHTTEAAKETTAHTAAPETSAARPTAPSATTAAPVGSVGPVGPNGGGNTVSDDPVPVAPGA